MKNTGGRNIQRFSARIGVDLAMNYPDFVNGQSIMEMIGELVGDDMGGFLEKVGTYLTVFRLNNESDDNVGSPKSAFGFVMFHEFNNPGWLQRVYEGL